MLLNVINYCNKCSSFFISILHVEVYVFFLLSLFCFLFHLDATDGEEPKQKETLEFIYYQLYN